MMGETDIEQLLKMAKEFDEMAAGYEAKAADLRWQAIRNRGAAEYLRKSTPTSVSSGE